MSLNRKGLDFNDCSVKFSGVGEGRTFSGYASKFGGVDSYGDTIIKGAYSKTLEDRQRPVLLRWNHYGPVIGKFTSLKEDDVGLYVEGELTKGHSEAENVRALLNHGAISGLSIGYRIPEGGAKNNETGGLDLYNIDLIEISVVETPADLQANITSIKSALEDATNLKEIESLLRDAKGFSRSEACALVAKIKAALLSESVEQEQKAAVIAELNQHLNIK